MLLIIDRFEGQFAICEKPDRSMIKVPRRSLPPEAHEGDVLQMEDGLFFLDLAATEIRKKAAAEQLRRLRQP